MIPLSLRLKKEVHRRIALTQDLILEEVYRYFPKAVLHGGTAIWRCYAGRRFSEDLNFYLPNEPEKLHRLFTALEKQGFALLKKKISANSVYSELGFDRVTVRLEATFQRIAGSVTDYQLADGNRIVIYSLTPQEFLKEKVTTYLKRRKVRDLYDIFFLLGVIDDLAAVKDDVALLVSSYEPPVDERDLRAILLEGITPSAHQMMEYIERKWRGRNI